MKIAVVNAHGEAGGAARAANRLHAALADGGAEVIRVVQRRDGQPDSVQTVCPIDGAGYTRVRLALDQLPTIRYGGIRNRSMFSTAWAPGHGRLRQIVHDQDIVNLHWVNKGFLPLRVLAQIRQPVVWTLHDMWPLTGGCHYDEGCGRWIQGCGRCPVLGSRRSDDLSSRIFGNKIETYRQLDLTFVAPSHWLGELARRSPLTDSHRVEVIPNPLNLDAYVPRDSGACRSELGLPDNCNVVAFVAMGGAAEPRKGFDLLCEALPKLVALSERPLCLLVIGATTVPPLPVEIPVFAIGHLDGEEELARAYSAADVLITPSRQDNLPNTVMEAMACGVPVTAFNVGGLSDLIDHRRTGYLAEPFDAEDLARGVAWVVADEQRRRGMADRARLDSERYRPEQVAGDYMALFESILQK